MLVEDHNGIVPQTFEDLEKLPGVGHKTASVVIFTAFGYAAAHISYAYVLSGALGPPLA